MQPPPRYHLWWYFWSVPASCMTMAEKSVSRVVDGNLATPARSRPHCAKYKKKSG